MLKQYKIRNYNFRLVFYVVTLTVIGILVITKQTNFGAFFGTNCYGYYFHA